MLGANILCSSSILRLYNGIWNLKERVISCVLLFMTPWTVALHGPLSLEVPRQEYWRVLPSQKEIWSGILTFLWDFMDFPGGSDGKSTCLQCRRPRFDPWVGKIPWRRKWQPTPVLLSGKSHGERILVGYSPWGHKELETAEKIHLGFLFLKIKILKSSSILLCHL